jgi:hypothetical protein
MKGARVVVSLEEAPLRMSYLSQLAKESLFLQGLLGPRVKTNTHNPPFHPCSTEDGYEALLARWLHEADNLIIPSTIPALRGEIKTQLRNLKDLQVRYSTFINDACNWAEKRANSPTPTITKPLETRAYQALELEIFNLLAEYKLLIPGLAARVKDMETYAPRLCFHYPADEVFHLGFISWLFEFAFKASKLMQMVNCLHDVKVRVEEIRELIEDEFDRWVVDEGMEWVWRWVWHDVTTARVDAGRNRRLAGSAELSLVDWLGWEFGWLR